MNNPTSRVQPSVTPSSDVYRRLLAFYPKEHRREFGPAMAQLFRDQCRDAWAASGSGGIALLWLRVLLDLAKTCPAEHLRSLLGGTRGLNRRFHLFLINRPLKSTFIAPFKWVLLGALGSSILLAWGTPKEYRGVARVALGGQDEDHSRLTRKSVERWTPAWQQAQLQSVVSDESLSAILRDFKLKESQPHLRDRISVNWTRLTTVIEITVYDYSAAQAAWIANALAEKFIKNDANQKLLAKRFGATLARAAFVDMAKPTLFFARPNRPLIIVTGLFGGSLLAAILGGLGVYLAIRFRGSAL